MEIKTLRVLLVEDDDVIRDVYQHYLEKEGFWVYTAGSGPDAVSFAENQDFDIILLDIIIPGFDGYTVLRKLRDNQRTKKTPVIILTNLDEEKYITRAMKLGASEFLIKVNSTPKQVVDHIHSLTKIKS